MVWDNGVRIIEHGEGYKTALVRQAESMEAFADWLAAHSTTVDSWDLAKIPATLRRTIIKVFDPATAESIAIANADQSRALWSDDHALQNLTAAELPVRRVWSQIVFPSVDSDLSPEIEFGHQLAAWLCTARFGFTRITPSAVIRRATLSHWKAEEFELNRLMNAFLETGVSYEGHLLGVHRLVYRLLTTAPSIADAANLTRRFFEHVADHPMGINIIDGLERQWNASIEMPIDVKMLMRLAVQGWRGRMLEFYLGTGLRPRDPMVNWPSKASTSGRRSKSAERRPRPRRMQ